MPVSMLKQEPDTWKVKKNTIYYGMLCFVMINSVLFNPLCVQILLKQFSVWQVHKKHWIEENKNNAQCVQSFSFFSADFQGGRIMFSSTLSTTTTLKASSWPQLTLTLPCLLATCRVRSWPTSTAVSSASMHCSVRGLLKKSRWGSVWVRVRS